MAKLKLLAFVALVGISACGRHSEYVSAAVDPAESPVKTEPLAIVLSVTPTIQERQLAVVLRDELCRSGFNLVASVDEAKWAMGLSFARQTYDFGTRSSAVILPAGNVAIGSSRVVRQTEDQAWLYLFRASDIRAGTPLRIWEGSVTADKQIFSIYRPVIFKNLLDYFGKNNDRPMHLDKSYLYDVRDGKALGCSIAE